MIPPIPPTSPQTGAPPPLGAPPPMAPPMGTPMPPSPMGKGIGSMLNTDPMARSDFSMMLSDIQNQSMIPPMPMHMNEGGLVGFIQNLLKGIGSIFSGGGGQQGGSGSLGAFERAFAEARAKGLKTFPFDRDGDGVDEIYTTRYEDEPIEGQAQTNNEVTQAVKKSTTPSDSELFDMLIKREAQQSRRDTPTLGNEFDVQGANKDSEAFANRLEQIKKEIERENYRRDVSERAGPEKLLEIMAQQSKAPSVDARMNMPAFRSMVRGLSGLDSSNTIDANLEEGNVVDNIGDRLKEAAKIVRDGGGLKYYTGDDEGEDQPPEIPKSPNLSQIMMGNNPKYFKDDNTSLGEKFQSLLKGLQNLGLSDALSDSIREKLEILGMGGSDKVKSVGFPDLTNPRIRALYPDREGYDLNFNQGGSVTEAIARLEKGGEPEDQKFKQMLQNLIGRDVFDLEQGDKEFAASMGLTAASYPILKSLISKKGALNKRLLNPNFDLGGKEVRDYEVDYKPISKRQMYQNALKRGLGNLSKTPSGLISALTYLLSASPAGEGEELKEFFNKQIVNKNEGGAINASNLGMAQGMGMGMGSGDNIQRLLYPLTTQIHRSYMQENDSDIKKKLDEFTQQVDQLTKSTFPDVSFQNQNTGLGSMPLVGPGGVPTGVRQFGVYNPNDSQFINESTVFNPFQNFVRTSDVKPNDINTFASSPFGKSLGSFFQDKFQTLQGYNTGGVVFDNLRDASIGSQIGDVVIVDGKSYIKSVGDGSATGTTFLKPIDTTEPDPGTPEDPGEPDPGTSEQAPAFLPGQQGVEGVNNLPPAELLETSIASNTNLPSENLISETATEVEDSEPVQVFGSLGSAEQGGGSKTFSDILQQSAEDSGINTYRKQLNRVTFQDPNSGSYYTYNFEKGEFEGNAPPGAIRNANLVAAQTGQDLSEISGLSGLVPVSGLYEGEDGYSRFEISEEFRDPSKYDYSGALGQSPSEATVYAKELAKDDKSDNDIYYTAPNGQTYVDTTGTGQGIPVGSYNIVRGNEALSQYYSVDEEGNRIGNIVGSGENFVQPALTKTETGYVATGSDKDPFEKNEDGVVSEESIQNHLTGDSFNIGGLEFTNPASNQINLEPFFNALESSGGLKQFLYSQQDRLPGFLNFLGMGDGKLTDFSKLDLTDLTNKFNEYLSGQDSEGNTSDLFGNTFQQTTDSNMIGSSGTGDISNTGNGSVVDDSTGDGDDSDDSDDNGGNETTPKTLFNFKDLYTNTEPMEDIIARTVVDSPVSSEGMGTFSPIDSSVVYNPDMFTDFSFPDPSDMTIRDNENPFETGTGGTGIGGTGTGGTGTGGTGIDGTGTDGTSIDGTGTDGTSIDGTSIDGTSTDGTTQPKDYSYLSNYNTLKEGGGAPDLALQTYERTGTVIPGYHGLISEYSGKPISELETFKVPDGYVPGTTNTANMNMGGMPSNGDVISKFLAMDIDKRPLSKTPKVADMSTLTASIKMNEGGEVTAGMNKAIDTFLASMM